MAWRRKARGQRALSRAIVLTEEVLARPLALTTPLIEKLSGINNSHLLAYLLTCLLTFLLPSLLLIEYYFHYRLVVYSVGGVIGW